MTHDPYAAKSSVPKARRKSKPKPASVPEPEAVEVDETIADPEVDAEV